MPRRVLVLFALLSACSQPVSEGAFIEQANARCRQINERFMTIPAPGPDSSQTDYLARALTVSRAGATGLRSVAAPAALRARYEQMLDAMDDANAGLAQALEAARAKDLDAVAAAGEEIAAAQTRFKDHARQLGLLTCVSAGSESS